MRRAALLAPLAALLAVAAAGCGGASLDPVARAATKTVGAGSYKFDYRVSVGATTMDGLGLYDAPDKRLSLTLSLSGTSMDAVADLSNGFVMYVRMPLLQTFLPQGKSWVRLDAGKLARKQGFDLSQVLQATQADPTQTLALLQQVGSSQELGHEQVDGVDTTHYRVTIDAAKLVAQQPTQAAKDAMQKALALGHVASYPIDVWVDGAGYLRRASLQLAEAGQQVRMDEHLSDFGTDATVALPPADQTVDQTAVGLGG